MTEKRPQSAPFGEEQDQTEVVSPTEKIEGATSTGAFEVPGAQNPDSEQVKQETNPNTE
jgi:hypothetical protein